MIVYEYTIICWFKSSHTNIQSINRSIASNLKLIVLDFFVFFCSCFFAAVCVPMTGGQNRAAPGLLSL